MFALLARGIVAVPMSQLQLWRSGCYARKLLERVTAPFHAREIYRLKPHSWQRGKVSTQEAETAGTLGAESRYYLEKPSPG